MFTNSCGANCSTKAMIPMSAPAASIARAASGSRSDLKRWTWIPLASAAARSASGRAPVLLGGAEDRRDVVAANQERVEDGLAEVLLADDDDFMWALYLLSYVSSHGEVK